MPVSHEEILARLLRSAQHHIEGIETRPRAYAWAPESLWNQAYAAIQLRQSILRPVALMEDPGETLDALHAFGALVMGEVYNTGLHDNLKREGRLDLLPGLLGDAARWIAREYPPEGTRRAEGAHAIRWDICTSKCRDCEVKTAFVGAKQRFRVGEGRWQATAPKCTWATTRRALYKAKKCPEPRHGLKDGFLCPTCGNP